MSETETRPLQVERQTQFGGMAPCMAMVQAAGIAGALAVETGQSKRKLSGNGYARACARTAPFF
jgi:hypothetical protein